MKKTLNTFFVKKLAIPFTLLLMFTSCAGREGNVTRTDFLLDTFVSVTLYGSDNTGALDGAISLCRFYDDMLNRHNEQSEVYRLNNGGGKPVAVSEQLRELLETAIYYCRLSDGKFDITVSPVADLWDFKAEDPAIPEPVDLERALSLVDWRNIEISGNDVTLRGGAQIDLGGIAKGYIADKLGEYLREEGIKSAIINLGGEILAIGGKPDGKPFEIGIQEPFETSSEIAGSVKIKDISISSSGTYERFFVLDKVLYHHILDPANGYPADSGLDSVTILSPRCVDGDALGTICLLLGAEKGMAIIEQLEGIEAVFLEQDGAVALSSGFSGVYRYVPKNEGVKP